MELEGGNRKPQTVHPEPSHDGDPIVEGKLSRSSSSCSSSASSFDPLTDSDHGGKEDILGNSTLPATPNSPTAEFVILPETSENPKTPEWSMISASPRAGPENSSSTPEWSMVSTSQKQSPPIQTMWRPISGYDPHRIPSSIFTSKPNTAMEWSVASNESLFSIQMGNTSFSGDYAILSGKSQELGRPDEFSNCNVTQFQSPVCETKSNELNRSPPTPILPTVIEAASNDRASSASSGEEKNGMKEVVDKKMKVVMKETVEQEVHAKPKVVVKETEEEHGKEITPPQFLTNTSSVLDGKEFNPGDGSRLSASTPRLSDESGTSTSSFAFPVLAGEERRSASVKVAPENLLSLKPPEKPKPKSKPQEAPMVVTAPIAAETSWFSCLSCRLPCC